MKPKITGQVYINNEKVMDLPIPKMVEESEMDIKAFIAQVWAAYGGEDFEDDTVSVVYDLGEGFSATFYKARKMKV